MAARGAGSRGLVAAASSGVRNGLRVEGHDREKPPRRGGAPASHGEAAEAAVATSRGGR
jgi:hypothetical protein